MTIDQDQHGPMYTSHFALYAISKVLSLSFKKNLLDHRLSRIEVKKNRLILDYDNNIKLCQKRENCIIFK